MSDNVLQDGSLIESRFAVERRDRDDPQPDAGVSLRAEAQGGSYDQHPASGRRGGSDGEKSLTKGELDSWKGNGRNY